MQDGLDRYRGVPRLGAPTTDEFQCVLHRALDLYLGPVDTHDPYVCLYTHVCVRSVCLCPRVHLCVRSVSTLSRCVPMYVVYVLVPTCVYVVCLHVYLCVRSVYLCLHVYLCT